MRTTSTVETLLKIALDGSAEAATREEAVRALNYVWKWESVPQASRALEALERIAAEVAGSVQHAAVKALGDMY